METLSYCQLMQRCCELAAENAALKESVEHAAGCISAAEADGLIEALESTTDDRLAELVHRKLCHAYLPVETPATESILGSLRAEGVEMLRQHPAIQLCSLTHVCDEVVAQLRSKSSPKHADPVAEIQIKNGDRDLFEEWVMSQVCISKSTLEGLRTESGYRNSTMSGKDYNKMWLDWNSNSQLRSKSEVQS